MIVTLETDPDTGDLILPLGDDLMKECGWSVGDTLEWIDNEDGTWTIRKKVMNKYVLVETLSQYRMRYVIEVPADHNSREYPCSATTWAEDTVCMEEGKEFSQKHLGETIVSSREVSRDEVIALCDQDNDYLKSWTDEKKIETFVTTIEKTK